MADGSVVIDSKLDSSGFKKGLSNMGNIAKKGAATIAKSFAAIATGVVGISVASAKVGAQFEKSMSNVAATMGMTAEEVKNGSKEFKILEDAAKKAGATTQFSATQSAEALNYLALAGYDASEAAQALPTVLNLAAAGGLDLASASDMVTDSMAALGLETSEMTSFTDKMAKTAQKSNTSVAQLGEAILTVGGTAKVLSGGVDEMNTALGILADNGIKGAEGGTALRNVILSLTAPTDKAKEALDNLGVSALDSKGNVRPLNETFKDLDKALSNMSDGEKTEVMNEIFNKVDLKSVNALLANSGERFDELSGYIEKADGAAANMAETMNDNLEGQITIMKSSLEGLGIQIYESLEIPLKNAAENVTASIGQVSEAIASGDMSRVGEVIGTLLADALNGLAEQLPNILEIGAGIVSGLVSGITEGLPQLLETGNQIISTIAQGISENKDGFSETIATVIKTFYEFMADNIDDILQIGIDITLALIDGITEALPTVCESAEKVIISLIEGVLENIDNIVDCGIDLIMALTNGLMAAIPKLIGKAPEIIVALVAAIIRNHPKILKCALDIVIALAGGIINSLGELGVAAAKLIAELIVFLGEGLCKLLEVGANIIKWLCDGITGAFGELANTTKNICSNVWNGITSTNWLELGGNIIKGIADGIGNAAGSVLNAIGDVCGGALDWAKNLLGIHSPSHVFRDEVGKYVGEGMAVGIEESTGSVSQATTDMCNIVLEDGKAFLKKQKDLDKAWSDSKKEQYSAQKTALMDYIAEKKELNELSLEDEKHIYRTLLKEAQGNAKELKEINKLILEADEEAYQERYANSKQFIADKKDFNEMSLEDELAAYERMKEYSKGHKEETKEIEKEIYDIKKEIREREIDNVKNTNDKILDELKDRLSREKDLINANKNSELASLQAQLDGIDEAEEKRQNTITRAGYETDITKIQEELANTDDVERQQELNEQLFEKQQAFDEWKYKQELNDKKDAIREQMEAVREQAESQIEVKENEYDKEKALLEKQQAMMIQAIQNGQMEMVNQIRNGGAKSLNIQDANATLAMGINRSLTKDKENNLNQQYQAVIDNENKSVQAVEDAAVEMYRTNYQMGCQMANGIADGILNTSWRAVKAVSMMCDRMIEETRSKLDIHSPSRVFKRLGGYVSEGMGNGVTNEMSSVINSVKTMSRGMIDAVDVSKLVGKLNSAVSGEMAMSNARFSGGSSSSYTNTTTNNNSSMPITVNNYGVEKVDKNFARDIGSEVARKVRSRGYAL